MVRVSNYPGHASLLRIWDTDMVEADDHDAHALAKRLDASIDEAATRRLQSGGQLIGPTKVTPLPSRPMTCLITLLLVRRCGSQIPTSLRKGRPAHRFRGAESWWLFQQLARRLEKAGRLQRAMAEGFRRNQVSWMLKASQSIIAANWGYTLTVHRPFHAKPAPRRAEFIETIRDHQRQPSRSVVIHFSGHWSVVQRTTATRFNMLDSFEYRRLCFADIRVGKPRTLADEENWFWLPPSYVFLLSDDSTS
jgi:hypothetical protein